MQRICENKNNERAVLTNEKTAQGKASALKQKKLSLEKRTEM